MAKRDASNDLLRAAEALLGAREDQMVTSEEWDGLSQAVAAAKNAPTIGADQVAGLLEALIDQVIEAKGDDDPLGQLAEDIAIERVSTFGAAGLMTRESGVVVTLADGSEFQVTVVRSR